MEGISIPSFADVLPDVELGPVRDREDPDVLAGMVAAVVQAPQLGPLVLRVPLAELVAEGEDPLLGPGLLLVAAGPAEDGVELVLGDGVEQGPGLQAVPRGVDPGILDHPAGVDRLLHRGHHQPGAQLGDPPVAELEHLGEVVAGVHVHHREGDAGRPERLLGQPQHDDRVLAAGEQQDRPLELGRHLPDDVDRLGLEAVQMGELYVLCGHRGAPEWLDGRCAVGGTVGAGVGERSMIARSWSTGPVRHGSRPCSDAATVPQPGERVTGTGSGSR